MSIDPLTDIMAPSCFEQPPCPPIYREVGADLGFFPDIKPLTIECVARLFDVPVELLDRPESSEVPDPPEYYGRWLHPEEIPARARRPWVGVEQLDATQAIPVVRDGQP